MIALGVSRYVAVQGDRLVEAYRLGIARFMEDMKEASEGRLAPIAFKVLGLMPTGDAAAILERARELGLDL
jgi:hypothetical protein